MTTRPNGHVWHNAFYWWVRSPHAPGISKNAYGLVGIPLIRAPQAPGDETNPLEGVKAWREDPLRPKEISRYRDTLSQIRAADNTAGRSATRHLEMYQTEIDLPLWQRNLSVLITVRRVHYGEIGKAPTYYVTPG